MTLAAGAIERVQAAVKRQRLIETAQMLCAIPSPTGRAGEVSNALAEMLAGDGFLVERPEGGHPAAPAVAVRWRAPTPGRTLQFDGHLDTVHLPFVPPKIEAGRMTGSGACDMKAGVAAAVEALRALRDAALLTRGQVLFTAHDLHESPWGDGSQLDRLIADGYVGDAALIPEYMNELIPIAGRGQATFRLSIRRAGPPIHEVMRPRDEPAVIAAGAELVRRFGQWEQELAERRDPLAGSESVFIGQMHSGEIYNQFPQECRIEGTRRWLPDQDANTVEADFRRRIAEVARDTGTTIDLAYLRVRGAFHLDPADPLVAALQRARVALGDVPLPTGGKPFVDDANTFWAEAGVPAITHGPRGGGAHTLEEWVDLDDLERVARVYALTALAYC
ncbi:MAG: M20/M25/M40 family metallo-hydrolase [Pirellulales bacterium]|nr:M20/M25/M40 family metallo-hydrolase [Pirellulales bacterium]